MNGSSLRRVFRGFTLIELLVVMGVIGVLAGILLPVMARAREQARRTECLSNLGQAQKALVIYGNSFNEYLPSVPGWGLAQFEYKVGTERISNYPDHYGISRNMVIGYGAETNDPGTLTPGKLNFVPVGLGMVVAREDLTADVLTCPAMSGTVSTFYGDAEYQYNSAYPRVINGSAGKPLIQTDGRQIHQTPASAGSYVAGILSAFSYRNHPFYSRLAPDNAAAGWTYTNDYALQGAEWTLEMTKPAIKAGFMCPPFKSAKQLGARAIISDSFDYAPTMFGEGMANFAHKDGYNVVYGDGHAIWFDDETEVIGKWNEWVDEDNGNTDNLTISSMSSQRAWNQFDRYSGIDSN